MCVVNINALAIDKTRITNWLLAFKIKKYKNKFFINCQL